ncbi:uncharacterized protein LOC122850422 [Aphidius gifuensis]|uniref:uncharacterized protein LOC122850422 n=1 Tax=Aphidius gifuensis TaxID=684658 RepID=UPI001CDBF974|nr:uncharacterized protein LOC122850422 [Aphidius gifuensis]
MDQRLLQMQMRKNFSSVLRQLEKNPNNAEIAAAICKIQTHIKDLNESLGTLKTSRKKMTSATVALLTSCKLKLQHLQKSGGTMQNEISTSSSPIIDNVIQADSINKRIRWTDLESAFQKRMTTGMFVNIIHKNLNSFFKDVKILLIIRLHNLLKEKSAIKLNTILACNFEIVKEGEIMIETKYFTVGCMKILQLTDLDELRVPFVVYADLESILEKVTDTSNDLIKKKFQQKHIPSSIAYYTKCSYDEKLSTFKLERSKNCIEWFINELQELAHNVDNILDDIKPMNLTFDEELEFSASTKCHICTKKFTPEDIKVRDHCHFTGAYRGAAHVGCNLNYQESCTIAVVFHGLSNYDSHFLIKQLKKQFPGTINLLALNKESYISFTKHVKGTRIRFRFIDSYKFMASSISTLANELEDKDKSISLSFCNNLEEFKLITKKRIFPYDYIDSWEKFNEEQLPSKLDFYSQLNEEHISEIDYNHACKDWKKFNIKNLDPDHYFTLPGLSFNAMLKYTEIELELITDADKLLFIEGGFRGGLSQCSHRHVIANNKYMSEYNPNIEDSYLMYFDVNNLYGFAIASTLPVSDFQWEENFDINKLNSIEDNSEWGYILEVDLDYPVNLHNEHKDLPLAPERRIPPLSTRMKIRKLYRVLKFKQRAWLKPYIDLNTELRTKATSLFAKNLFKSLINICFGKMLESTRSQRIIKLVSRYGGRGRARALISKPNFHSALIIDDLVIIEMKRLSILLNKPIYGDKVKFAYMDTDSAILHICTPDIYEFIRKECDNFDTSDYPIDNRYNIPQKNKKVPGIMKDECNGEIMKEFIGLRSKAYSFLVENESCDNNVKLHKKAKGKAKFNKVRKASSL